MRVRGDWQNRAINHVPAWQGSSAAYPAVQLVSRAGMLLLPATIPSDRDAPLPEVRGIHQCGRCDRDWRVSCTVDPADAKEAALVWQGSSAAYPAVQLVSQAGMPPRAKALLSQGCAAAGSPAGEGISQGHTPPGTLSHPPGPMPGRTGMPPPGCTAASCQHHPPEGAKHTAIVVNGRIRTKSGGDGLISCREYGIIFLSGAPRMLAWRPLAKTPVQPAPLTAQTV